MHKASKQHGHLEAGDLLTLLVTGISYFISLFSDFCFAL